MADPGIDDSEAPRRPSVELTEDPDSNESVERMQGGSPVKVAALDAEHLRNAVAARLFGGAVDPVKIGRFTVLKRLGAGGMGVVYSAYDDQIDRKIAIKLLRGVDEDKGTHSDRLKREAQALGKLSHPNVVTVYEVADFRGQVYVAMEFVEGKTLREWVPDAGDAVAQILDKFTQAGLGLAAAHAAGLVHRDFKPDNALVGADGRVRVLDFGLARGLSEVEPDPERTLENPRETMESSHDSLRQPLTRTGAILGTPAYMAPEQHLGLRADARSDQFAFCVALWEKLYGERPFHGTSLRALALAVTDGEVQEPSNARAVPQWIRRALERGLDVTPERRWPDMPALLAALAHDPRKRRRGWIAAASLATIAIAATLFALTRDEGPDPCEGGEQQLAGIWDDEVRERVHASFEQTGVSYANEAWVETSRLLDGYATEWIAMDREVCEARLANEQDTELLGRRMVCLGQRRTELEQLTELLVEADDGAISRAVVAAGSLAQISACANEQALVAETLDPERLDELEHLLASASGRKALGKYDEGLTIAKQAVDEARALGTAHGEGRALLLLGDLQAKNNNPSEAKATLREALRRADVAGDDATRVQALTQLMRVSFLEHDLDEGEVLAADARAALDRLGSAPLLEADFYLHYGSLALARGDNETAGEYHRRALAIREAQLGADHPEVAISLINIANSLIGEGSHAEAEQLARRALVIFERKFGADHPYTAASHNAIGNSLNELGRYRAWDDPEAARPYFEQAIEHYMRAIAIRETNVGREHPSIAVNLHNLGEAQRRLGQWNQALASYQRALEIKRKKFDGDHPNVIASATGLGRVLLELGQVDEAVRVLEESADRIGDREVPADVRGERAFALARALVAQAESKDDASREAALERARELANQAASSFGEIREEYAGELREVERWLLEHPAPEPAPASAP
ncbi:tetratricopeptide repeat protein [Nannocystaceae bacterium ST9]